MTFFIGILLGFVLGFLCRAGLLYLLQMKSEASIDNMINVHNASKQNRKGKLL